MSRINQVLLVSLLFIVATSFAIFGIDRSPITWVDEVFYAEPARQVYLNGSLVSPIFFNVRELDSGFFLHPPVYFLIQSGIFYIFGFSQMAARLPSVFYYLISIALVYLTILNLLESRRDSSVWALLGSSFFAFDNTIIQEVRSGRSGGLAILLMLLSFFVLNKKDWNLHVRIFLSSFFGGIASLTHPAVCFLIFGYFLNILFNKNYNNRMKILIIFCFSCSIVFIPYLVYILVNFDSWQSQFLAHSAGSTGGGVDGFIGNSE